MSCGAEDIHETLKSFGFFFFRGQREVDICFGVEGVKMALLALLEGHVNLAADRYIGLQRHWVNGGVSSHQSAVEYFLTLCEYMSL